MTTPDATYLILFATNLAFIVTHLFGWLLKWFYKPEAYRDHFRELFPAQRYAIATLGDSTQAFPPALQATPGTCPVHSPKR